MNERKRVLFLFGIIVILVLACNLPGSPPPSSANVAVNATLTSLALTRTAISSQPSIERPSFTPDASLLPTITPTISPYAPIVTVSAETNCRGGPGDAYDYLTYLLLSF